MLLKIGQIILIILNIQVTTTLLKVNQFYPQNIYSISLKAGNTLKIITTWPIYPGQITNINLYLYIQGTNLLSTNNAIFSSTQNSTINPQTLTCTINTTNNYYLRIDLQTGNLVSYQLQIFVNNININNLKNLIVYPYFTFSIYSFSISNPSTISLTYIGPSLPINLLNSSQSVFSQTTLFSIPANQSLKTQIFNLTANGTYYILIQHGISSTKQLIPFTLLVNQIPCKLGYIMNQTISTCVKNCSADINSHLIYSPWDINQCYCLNGFQWDTINLACKPYRRCQYDMNVNGRLSCDISGDYLNIKGNAPNDLFPIALNVNDALRVEGSWVTPATLYLILYSAGMDLLSPNCMQYATSNGSIGPAILQYTSTSAGTYYIRADQSGGWHVNYNIKIIVNNVVKLLHTGLLTPPSFSWSAFHWGIVRQGQIKISYSGPNYTVKIFSPSQVIFNPSVFSATIVGNTITPIILNVSEIGNWFAVVYHGMTSPIYTPLKFSLIITPIINTNFLVDGFYFNRSINSYARNCYTDPFSTKSNTPWDLSQCICQRGFIWNTIFQRCIRDCPNDTGSNGQFIYSNCELSPSNVIKNTSSYFPSNIYPIYLSAGSNLSVHLNWSAVTNATFLLGLYSQINNFYANISIPSTLSIISPTQKAIFYSSPSNSTYYIGINSSSLTQINQITTKIYINTQLIYTYNDYVVKKTSQFSIIGFDVQSPTFVDLIFTTIDLGQPTGYIIYIFQPNQSIFGVNTYAKFQQSNATSIYHFQVPYVGKWFITVNSSFAVKNLNIQYQLVITQKKCLKIIDIPQCQCINNFYWNITLMSCVRNCSGDINSQCIFSQINQTQCLCNDGYLWSDTQIMCVKIQESNDYYYQIYTIFGKILIFSTFNFVPTLIKCLYLFFDDMWYYKFHRIQYPDTVKMFMEPVNIIYQFRVNPWFFKYVEIFENITIAEQEQKQFNNYITQNIHNPDGFYFLTNSSDLYIKNMLMNTVFFLLAKILCFLVYIISLKFQRLKKLYNWMIESSKWWSLMPMIIQSNLIVIVFSASLQLLIPNSLNFTNKYNLIICFFYLFFAILYSLAFYQIIYRFQSKNPAQTILGYSLYGEKNFRFQTFAFLARTVTRGMIQGLSFQKYQYQIIALAVSDLVFSIIVFMFRKQFCHMTVFLSTFIYNLLFLCLDIIFAFHFKYPLLFEKINYDLLTYCIIWSIIGAYCLIFIFLIIVKFGYQYLFCKKQTIHIIKRINSKKKITNRKIASQYFYQNPRKKMLYPKQNKQHQCTKFIKKIKKYPKSYKNENKYIMKKDYIPAEQVKDQNTFTKINPKLSKTYYQNIS